MSRKDDTWMAVLGLVFILVLALGVPSCMVMRGYHLTYSWVNGRMIWVDSEGKP